MAKRSSDPRVAYPEFKVQVRDLVRIVGMVDPFAPRGGGSVLGGNSFHRAPGGKCPVPGAPSSGTPRKSQAKFMDGTVWGL